MADTSGGPPAPEYTPEPEDHGLWARLKAAPAWVKVAVPAAVIGLAVLVGVLIGQAGSGSSTAASDAETERLLAELAEKLAQEQAAASTTIPVTLPETTTTVAETTTTVAETTTTVPATTTTVPATTTTVPATTTTVPATTTATTTAPVITTIPATTTTVAPTTEPPPTEPPTTEPPPTEPPTTEPPPTEPPPTEPGLPPGALFGSLDDLQTTWNSTAQGTPVAAVTSWTTIQVLDQEVDIANLGGNLRLAAVTGDGGSVTQVVLAWLPLSDEAEQPSQNALFQDSFAVLVQTVNPGATSGQQADLAAELGLSAEQPPFPVGADATSTLGLQRYQLEAVEIPGQDGPVTLIGARGAALR